MSPPPMPWLLNQPTDSEDVIPTPMPRSKPPMPKKRTAPRPAPRSVTAIDSDADPQKKMEEIPSTDLVTPKKTYVPTVVMSALSLVPAIDISSDISAVDLKGDGENCEVQEDELVGDNIYLELFNNATVKQTENNEQETEDIYSKEEFNESLVKRVQENNGIRTVANVLNNGVEDSTSGHEVMEMSEVQSGDAIEGFSLSDVHHSSQIPDEPTLSKNSSSKDMQMQTLLPLIEKQAIHPIRQVECVVNFSNIERGFPSVGDDPSRFSSNSLCSEVNMPFVDGGGSTKMNRWRNMEALDQSLSLTSLEKQFKEMVTQGESSLEEGDPISANWVVGYESDTEVNGGGGSEEGSSSDSMASDSIDEVDCVRQDNMKTKFDYPDKSVKPILINEPEKDALYNHNGKINGMDVTPTVLPSPPPSLEYMALDGGKSLGADGHADGAVEQEDLDWEYKLPAPPTGFQDEDERGEEVEEAMKKRIEDERETWVAESETLSIPSTLSSAPSRRKMHTVGMDNQPLQHLPNFRMSTYKTSSDDGWEDPREDITHGNTRRVVEEGFTKSNGRTFIMLNSDNEVKSEKSYNEVGKHLFETWASVSSKSSLNKAHYSTLDLSNSTPCMISSMMMTTFKDTVENGVKSKIALKNGPCVVRVSSFGGKPTKVLKRSLSSTSSLVSRHSTDGKDFMEKVDREMDSGATQNNLLIKNGMENHSLSHSLRTVSLHDLAINSIQEESRLGDSQKNCYHDESTTPKIVSSKWKIPHGENGTKYGAQKLNSLQNLRKTNSELGINQGYTNGWKDSKDELGDAIPQTCLWQEDHALDNSIQEPLKSLQVLKGVLPHLKKSLSIDLKEKDDDEKQCHGSDEKMYPVKSKGQEMSKDRDTEDDMQTISSKSISLPRPNNHQLALELTQGESSDPTPKHYSYAGPPAINFSTWSERPKSEVSLKRDNDYRIGVGQAPFIRETHSQLIFNAQSPVRHSKSLTLGNPCLSSHLDSVPPCLSPKPATNSHVTVKIVSAAKTETVSRLPIVRSVELKKTTAATNLSRAAGPKPMSCKFPSDLCEELSGALASLVDANRNGEGKQSEEVNERRRQQIPTISAVPPPPPPLDVVASVHQTATVVLITTNLRRVSSSAGYESSTIRMNGFMGHEKRQGMLPFAPVVKGFRLNSIPMPNNAPSTPVQLPNVAQTMTVQHSAAGKPPPPAVVWH